MGLFRAQLKELRVLTGRPISQEKQMVIGRISIPAIPGIDRGRPKPYAMAPRETESGGVANR
jgi:hypothetical protein